MQETFNDAMEYTYAIACIKFCDKEKLDKQIHIYWDLVNDEQYTISEINQIINN